MGAEATTEAFVICKLEKVSIPLKRGEIPRLYRLSPGYFNRRRAN